MYHVIQPTTTERVLSGVCYTAQWLYIAMKEQGLECYLHEDVSMTEVDRLFLKYGFEDTFIINLSSYPQKELCLQIWRDYRNSHDVFFSGYEPLIDSLKLPRLVGFDLFEGVRNYHKYFDKFWQRYITDYDSHIVSANDGKRFAPLFLSSGCERKCPYCYVGYSNFPHGYLPKEETFKAIETYESKGVNIHFYDEDLFAHPDIDEIIQFMHGSKLKWICLATGTNLAKTIDRIGEKAILDSGNVLNEVGVETLDSNVLNKKQSIHKLLSSSLQFFWLTVTFFPTETLNSKRLTGDFLKKFGYGYDELLPRIRTNSSHGGLGQFFQAYHGTPWHEKIESMGRIFTEMPTRLWPSFVGHKFLNEKPKLRRGSDFDERWLRLYTEENTPRQLLKQCNGRKTVFELANGDLEKIVSIAQLAQLGVIK